MPTIKYPKNPNIDTAFVEQEDGTKNRALMIAPQDISTLELPNNPNSTKGYITVDGKKQRVILTADITGEGGGGSSLPDQTGHSGEFLTTDGTDASWAAVDALPDQTGNAGKFLTTDGTDASWSDKPLVNEATGTGALTILGTATTQDGNINIGSNSVINASSTSLNNIIIGTNTRLGSGIGRTLIDTVLIGTNSQAPMFGGGVAIGGDTYVYDVGLAAGWKAESRAGYAIQLGRGANSTANTFSVGLSASNNYRLLDSDGTIPSDRLVHAINKYSTMPTAASTNEGWIVQFTGTTDSTYTHGHLYECVSDGGNPATYSWTEVSMGGGGSSYTAGTGIDITSGVISVTTPTLQNTATGANATAVSGLGNATATNTHAVAFGNGATANGVMSTVIGTSAKGTGEMSVVVGPSGQATAKAAIAIGSGYAQAERAIMLGYGHNNEAHTLHAGTYYNNTELDWKLLDLKDGTIPADRLASTTGLADGNYRLRLTMTNGVPSLSWVAE